MRRCIYEPVYRKSLASEVDSGGRAYFNAARERWAALATTEKCYQQKSNQP